MTTHGPGSAGGSEPPGPPGRDPWARSPVDELGDQALPRWFVVTALALIPVAIATLVAAFVVFGPQEVPVAARRPPPGTGLSHAVGAYEAGSSPAVAYERACALLSGVRIAGTEADRQALRTALAGLCNVELAPATRDAVRAFADAGGVVRFARFEATGVDSTTTWGHGPRRPPVIYVNAKFARTEALWIAPLVAHDAMQAGHGASGAERELAARRAEARLCDRLFGPKGGSRACDDARTLLGLDDPLGALREAGYR